MTHPPFGPLENPDAEIAGRVDARNNLDLWLEVSGHDALTDRERAGAVVELEVDRSNSRLVVSVTIPGRSAVGAVIDLRHDYRVAGRMGPWPWVWRDPTRTKSKGRRRT